jgi:hypothetical protein
MSATAPAVRELDHGAAAGDPRLHGLHARAGRRQARPEQVGVRRARRAPGQEALAVELGEAHRPGAGQAVAGGDVEGGRRRAERRAVHLHGPRRGTGEDERRGPVAQQLRHVARPDLVEGDRDVGRALAEHPRRLRADRVADGRRDADAHRPGEALPDGPRLGEGAVGRRQHVLPRAQQRPARGRERHLAVVRSSRATPSSRSSCATDFDTACCAGAAARRRG